MSSAKVVSSAGLARLLGNWREGGVSSRALADRIALTVLDGRVLAGTRLPAERDLADRLEISRRTVSAAYAVLRDRGVTVSLRGSGTSVRPTGDRRPLDAGPAGSLVDLSHAVPVGWSGLPGPIARAADRAARTTASFGIDFSGLEELRIRIAERYGSRGVPTLPEQILVTTGAQHAIGLTVRALLARGDRLAIDLPSYPNAIDAFRDAGVRLLPLAMPDGEADVDAWETTLLTYRPAAAYLMPDFHNPTGSSLPDEGRRRILLAAARAGTLLLVDETTAELDIDRAGVRTPMAALATGTGAAVVSIGSVGKTIWHGLRIGWIRTDEARVQAIAARRPASDLGTPVLDQLVVSEALADFDAVLLERIAALRGTRDAVLQRLRERFPEWRVPTPVGGLCVWVTLPTASSSLLVQAAALEGLRITAGPRFGIDGAFERHLRIPITAPADRTLDALDRLALAWSRSGVPAQHRDREFTPVL